MHLEIEEIPNERAKRILECVLRQPRTPVLLLAWTVLVWPPARRVLMDGDGSDAAIRELERASERWAHVIARLA